jgi:hypothetical protein
MKLPNARSCAGIPAYRERRRLDRPVLFIFSRGGPAPHKREWRPSRLLHLVSCGNLALEGPRARPRIRTAIVMLRVGFATHTSYSAPVRNRGIDHV